MFRITINGVKIMVEEGTSIQDAARDNGIYIPVLCSHPDLKPFGSIELSEKIYQGDKVFANDPGATIESIRGCGLCIVEIEGDVNFSPSCKTIVKDGMVIKTDTDAVKQKRKENLIPIMAKHPHSCLTCSQRQGCITTSGDCSNSVIFNERCCEINGNCELQRITDYIGIAPETPKYHHLGIPRIEDANLFMRDYNLCISCGRCVRACQQSRNVYALGAVINDGKLIIGTVNGPSLEEADCRFCGACVEVCPTGAIQDKRKPRLKEFNDYVPCRANCPGNTDIPAYLKLIADGDYTQSAEVIASRLSFPHSLGKICFHPCETDCRRNSLSGAMSIRQAKDFAMSRHEPGIPEKEEATGKSISIVGAGPSGMTAGFYLSLKGHKVTIYEKEEKIGGMLRYGIPRYRLPEETLEKDLKRLMKSGFELKTGVTIGKDISIYSMLENGADAVYIANGLSQSKRLPGTFIESKNVLYGIEFLRSVSIGELIPQLFAGKKVIIVGGGNVATDAARTAVRLGAEKTTMVCLEQFDDMPAYRKEIEESIEEGIEIINGWGIANCELGINNIELTLNLKQCASVFDDKGIFSPKFDESILNEISGNCIIMCIGQEADKTIFNAQEETSLMKRGLIKTKDGSFATEIKGVFAGGDVVSGPASVIDAVGSGKQAAREIDIFLGGDGIISGDNYETLKFEQRIGKIEGFSKLQRKEIELLSPEKRKSDFAAVELGYDEATVKSETMRCLQCNLRFDIKQNPYPPAEFIIFNKDNIAFVDEKEGVVQLLNSAKEIFIIKGSDNVRETLIGFLEEGKEAEYFIYEYDPLFSKRESELVQKYLQKHGEMPDSGDGLDDLF